MEIIDPQVMTGIGVVLGAIGGGYAAVKKLPFFKKNGNAAGANSHSQGCPDPSCHNEVMNTSRNVADLKGKFEKLEDEIFPKINGTAEDVAEIKGYIRGLHNSNH